MKNKGMLGQRRDVTFTNAAGEDFHLAVFGGADEEVAGCGAPPVLFCVHGAGMSGASFYRLAEYLQEQRPGHDSGAAAGGSTANVGGGAQIPQTRPPRQMPMTMMPMTPHAAAASGQGNFPFAAPQPDAQAEDIDMCVITYDQRCHGQSTHAGGEGNLSLDVLVQDFLDVLAFAKQSLYPRSTFFILGHSVGGPVVVQGLNDSKVAQERVGGVVLVDVVEGTAKLSLKYMNDFLKKRPDSFTSVKDAETWFLQHGGMHSHEGAAVSVPSLLRKDGEDHYVWITNLHKMEAVWDTWFDGLDAAFISLPFSKMLCLANAERLDTALTVAQMQGKFQFEIVGSGCGHYIMDDATVVLGSKLRRFVKRIVVLTDKLKCAVKPGTALHLNNATVPPSRQQ